EAKSVQSVKLTLATDASDAVALAWPTAVAWKTCAETPPGRLASSIEASCAPPVSDNGLVFATDTALPATVPETADASPRKPVAVVAPTTICAFELLSGKQQNVRLANTQTGTGLASQRLPVFMGITSFLLH